MKKPPADDTLDLFGTPTSAYHVPLPGAEEDDASDSDEFPVTPLPVHGSFEVAVSAAPLPELVDAAPEGMPAPEAPASPDQVAFFDLDALTVRTPEDEMRAQLEAQGLTPEAKYRLQFSQTTLRQLVFVFSVAEYAQVKERLVAVRERAGLDTNKEALLWLLRQSS